MRAPGLRPGANMDALPDQPRGPLPAYRAKVAAGELAPDPPQALAAERLQDLWIKLRGYDPPPRPVNGNGFLSRLIRRRPTDEAPEGAPNGLYLVGEVGRGKSMLMDLFFATAQVRRKRRVHFYRFMQDVHARFHAFKQAHPNIDDPIPPLADAIAAESILLCFDEFQVNDIADAMILGRLFQALFERGVIVIATSNTRPDDLFRGQPGRDAFLPFIALLKRHLDVLEMDQGRDYRRARLRGLRIWHVPADDAARRALDHALDELSGHVRPAQRTMTVTGHPLVIPAAADGVARFSFDELCGAALGPGDYLALATHFHTIIIDDIPRLSADDDDRARQFITLIDTLYDHRVKLLASAATPPDGLYTDGRNAAMFARTASRLAEMQSEEWLTLPHLT